MSAPRLDGPGRLVSLRDLMHKIAAGRIVSITNRLTVIESGLTSAALTEEQQKTLEKEMAALERECATLEAPSTLDQIKRVRWFLEDKSTDANEARHLVRALTERFAD